MHLVQQERAEYTVIDDLEAEIVALAREIDAITYRYLTRIREFDERHGWKAYGCTDCAHWLAFRCGLTIQTAADHVRVARGLKDLACVSEGLKEGRLSYSKVRALVRLATPETEAELVQFAETVPASVLEGRIREFKNGSTDSLADARRIQEMRSLKRSINEGAGTMTIEVVLPLEQGERVMKAIESATADEDPLAPADYFARQADALVTLTCGTPKSSSPNADHTQVLIHVDESALRGAGGRSDVPLETARRLLCDGSIVPIVENEHGEPLDVGRKQRTIPTAIRRALYARDRSCAFPGCTHVRFLDAHHVRHWADGGKTNVDNLVLLCTYHHRAVHEGGFHIRRDHEGAIYFINPKGRALPACGRLETLDTGDAVSAESLKGVPAGDGPGQSSIRSM